MNQLQRVFEYEGQQVRTTLIDGNPWFMADTVDALRSIDYEVGKYLGYVYALEIGSRVKIGMTSQPYTRLQNLASVIAVYGAEDVGRVLLSQAHTNYQSNERALHAAFGEVRVGRELFNMSLDNLIDSMPALRFVDESSELAEKAERSGKRLRQSLDKVLLAPMRGKCLFILRIDNELWTYHGRPEEAFTVLADMAENDGFSFLDGDVYVSAISGMRAVCLEDLSAKEATA